MQSPQMPPIIVALNAYKAIAYNLDKWYNCIATFALFVQGWIFNIQVLSIILMWPTGAALTYYV